MFFETLFPSKDINIDFEDGCPPAQIQAALEDRNDVILKLKNDPAYSCELRILYDKLKYLKNKISAPPSNGQVPVVTFEGIRFGFEVCELL